jgi:hypothetical protein
MRHIGKGGLVSSCTVQSEDAIIAVSTQENTARSAAFTRACQRGNITKVARMLKSGSLEVEEKHFRMVEENDALRDLLVHHVARINGVDVSKPRCLDVASMPWFLVEHVLDGERAFVAQRSNRFTCRTQCPLTPGKLVGCSDTIFKLLSFLEGCEMREWLALSSFFAFGICDTVEFARLHYRNTFAGCYAE